jgi:hypothetical protein
MSREVAAGFCASDKSGCPGLTAKGRHNRLNAIYELPCSPEGGSSDALSEAFRKGVLVQRCVSFFFCLFVLCVASAAQADQSPTNSFAGQIMSGYDGKRVGIGTTRPAATLDVYQGEIKIGSTGVACTAELAGALRSAGKHLEFCDGSGWQIIQSISPKQPQ